MFRDEFIRQLSNAFINVCNRFEKRAVHSNNVKVNFELKDICNRFSLSHEGINKPGACQCTNNNDTLCWPLSVLK